VKLHHFGKILHGGLERGEFALLLAVPRAVHEHVAGKAGLLLVQQGDVALDEPGLLQRAHPPEAGGCGEAHPPGELHVADAAVALQLGKDHFVKAVEGHGAILLVEPSLRQKMPQIRASVTDSASRLRWRGCILHDWIESGKNSNLETKNMRIGVPKE